MAKQDVTVELYYGGAWHAAPAYVRDPVTITRGYRDEGGDATASTADLTLDNRSGDYNPKNAASSLYGLIGRNTPLRAGLTLARDAFARTLTSGWGSADSGQAWTGFGAGGTVSTTDYTVSGGQARHFVPVALAYRATWLSTVSLLNVEVAVTVDMVIANVVGGSIEPAGILLRMQDSSTYYMARVEITTAEQVTIKLYHSTAGQLAAATVFSIFWSGQPLRVVAAINGDRLSAKVWDPAGDEPLGWQVTATDGTLTAPGGIGIRSGVAAGNTNSIPVEFRYDDLEVTDRRFTGEVSSWKPDRTIGFNPVTGKGDAWTEVEAAGILRRLDQGADVLDSPLRRAILATSPTAYWPLEDADGALSAQSAVPGVDDMQPFGYSRFTAPVTGTPVAAAGLPKFGSGAGIPGSAPVVDLAQGGVLTGVVPSGSGSGWRFEFVMTAPRDKAAARIPIRWTTDGTFPAWELQIESTGLFATFRTSVGAGSSGSATATFNVFDGRPHHYQIEAFQSGGSVDARIYVDDLLVAVFGGTLTGSPGSIRAVTVNPGEEVNGTESMPVLGHVPVWNQPYSGLTNTAVAMLGHAGETAAARFLRLCAEEGVEAVVVGDAAGSRPMGAQRIAPFTELLEEIASTDDGLLYEPRDFLGLVLRTGRDLYNQTSVFEVDYAANEVALPFAPVIDDQRTRNDVTAKSTTTGVTARDVLETGRMSVLPPPTGVGRYTTQLDVNPNDLGDVANLAGWARHKGTVDEVRFARLTVDLVASPGLTAAAAAADVGDLTAVVNLPDDVTPDDASLLALGYTETIGSHRRSITFNAAPGSPYTVATADGEPRVAADGSTLAADLSATAISTLNSNPYFETTASPWTAVAGGTVARSTAQAHEGVASLLFTPNGVTATVETRSENAAGVVAGQAYRVSAWVRCAVARSVNANIVWRDAGGVFLSSAGAVSVSVAATTWALVEVSGTAPALAAQAQISVSMGSTPPTSHLLHIDEALLRTVVTMQLASTPENGVWTTDPADFPLDVRVGGERMTLSAITGTTSPQPGNISARAVNGVSRAWPAGTEVDVWTPAIAAL